MPAGRATLSGGRARGAVVAAVAAVSGAGAGWAATGAATAAATGAPGAAASGSAVPVALVCALAILAFATRILPEIVTALVVFLAFLALGAAPTPVIFSGFETGGFWLLFSGLVLGAAIARTGLGERLARRIHAHTGNSTVRAMALLVGSGLALGLLVPSTIPRVIVLMPVAAALAETMGHRPGSRGQIGLAMAAAAGTLLPTYAILTANLPTIVQYGALETLYGLLPSYGGYLLAQLPVNLVRLAILLAVLLPFAAGDSGRSGPEGAPAPAAPAPAAPAAPAPAAPAATAPAADPLTAPQRRLLAVLALAIGFWVSDALHGISPAWIALAAAAFVLWPRAGLLPSDGMKSLVDLSPAFFMAGIFSVSAVAGHVGLDRMLAEVMVPRLGLAPGAGLHDIAALSAFSMLVSHLTTAPAAPVVLAPLAGPMAEASGLSIEAVAMAQIIGISTPLLPYQAPPLILAMALAQIPAAALTRLCLSLALGVALVGLPLTWLWWRLIGLI